MIPTLHNMARIALQARELQRTVELWSEALSLAMETRDAMGIFHVAGQFGSLLASLGNHAEARGLLGLAVQVGKSAGLPGTGRLEERLLSLGPE